jgi:ABC-type glutathione transport system ATPase component
MDALQDPTEAFGRYSALLERRKQAQIEVSKQQTLLIELDEFLGLEPKVLQALDQLDNQLFKEITTLLEDKLSIALQEVLEQSIRLKVKSVMHHKSVGFEFSIERDGHEEHILKGCGGSVANILSVGLRLFALTCLSEEKHRRFLVLDEQDCWIQPELIPRFMKIIREAAKALNFQILMISHHDPSLFFDQADRVFQLDPHPDGVKVRILGTESNVQDHNII